jgi:hypothetical protein
MHGGRSLVGSANPAYKTGRYSRLQPKGLRERFEALQEDPELLSLRSDITLVDSRIGELLDQLDPGPEPWASPVWATVVGLLGERRMLVAQEASTTLKLGGVVPVEEVEVFVSLLLSAVGDTFPDGSDRRRLISTIYRLADRPEPEGLALPEGEAP